ncbi:MAG: NAD(P)H-hydrate dehydratase [Candidatus Zixiibacteriota bacterium]
MILVTADEMRAIDSRAINDYKIPSLELMENAGRGIFHYIEEVVAPEIEEEPAIAIVCGRGNNGGDGFVVGRYLFEAGYDVVFLLAGTDEKLSDDCRVNYDKVIAAGYEVVQVTKERDIPDLHEFDLIIDAIFGTGFSGAPRGISAKLIDHINASHAHIVSVDAPSGLDVSTGKAETMAVMADFTTTLALPKPGLYVSPGREFAGFVAIIPIGIPQEVVESFGIQKYLINDHKVAHTLPQPKPDGHKGDFGKVFILAGSPGLTGAAYLSGLAAARSGAGLVTVGVPKSLNPILEMKLTEVMTVPLPEVGKRSVLALRGKGEIRQHIKGKDAIAIGPGIGRHHETGELIRRLIGDITCPCVIDADGLYPLSGEDSPLLQQHGPLVLTPHPGEFARLTGETPSAHPLDNFELVAKWAKTFNAVIVLKGSPTIIGTPEGEVYMNSTGNFGMATGGSGDVLTGIIVTMLAQGLEPLRAAGCGVFIHGLAGDMAIEHINPRSLIAGDVIEFLSSAFDALIH